MKSDILELLELPMIFTNPVKQLIKQSVTQSINYCKRDPDSVCFKQYFHSTNLKGETLNLTFLCLFIKSMHHASILGLNPLLPSENINFLESSNCLIPTHRTNLLRVPYTVCWNSWIFLGMAVFRLTFLKHSVIKGIILAAQGLRKWQIVHQ